MVTVNYSNLCSLEWISILLNMQWAKSYGYQTGNFTMLVILNKFGDKKRWEGNDYWEFELREKSKIMD